MLLFILWILIVAFGFLQGHAFNNDYQMHLLALGDWGTTRQDPESCCRSYKKYTKDSDYRHDYWAQDAISFLLAQSASYLNPKPSAILAHGDNFYNNGVGEEDRDERFETTFEQVYNQEALKGIPWFPVMGNHDFGGAYYICGEKEGSFRKCNSIQEMITSLEKHAELQTSYISPNGNRWKFENHIYYKNKLKSPVNPSLQVEIFSIDTNAANFRGASATCCQCWGYAEPNATSKRCKAAKPGDSDCAGGDIEMYHACMNQLEIWSLKAIENLRQDLKDSTATYKIIQSHFSPYFHMKGSLQEKYFDLLQNSKVHLWINGHDHHLNHLYSSKLQTHFIENGAGGGIYRTQSEFIHPPGEKDHIQTIWDGKSLKSFGFYELSFTPENLYVRAITFDGKWSFHNAKTRKQGIQQGNMQVIHCHTIPVDYSSGFSCSSDDDRFISSRFLRSH